MDGWRMDGWMDVFRCCCQVSDVVHVSQSSVSPVIPPVRSSVGSSPLSARVQTSAGS